jgi:hypothetical protein
MPKLLTVGNEEFEFPLEGENPGYGSEITDWAEAVTTALSTVQKPNDIPTRTESILNRKLVTLTSIPGFNFNTSEVISIECKYFIQRSSSTTALIAESGFIEGYFDGTDWGISRRVIGDAGMLEISITTAGQIQYRSSDIGDLSYAGTITFEAKVINK